MKTRIPSYRERVGRAIVAFLIFFPPSRPHLSPRITIDAAVRGEIEDTADVTT